MLKEKSIVPIIKKLEIYFFSFKGKKEIINKPSPWYIIYLKLTCIESIAVSDNIFFKEWLLIAPIITDINANNTPKILAFFTI